MSQPPPELPGLPVLPERIEALRHRPITATEKGFGVVAAGRAVTAAELAQRRPHAVGPYFTMPLLVLRDSAIRKNAAAMAAWCARAGVVLAPHGKTTMAPQLFARQLAAGAWGITAATIGQVQVYRAFGVQRVLLANELTDRAGIAWLAAELNADPGFDCYAYVDSLAGVTLLDEALRANGASRPLPVLVELGFAGGRTGCRTVVEALVVAAAAERARGLTLAGAAGFEGGIGTDASPATLDAVASYCRRLRELAGALPGAPAGGTWIVSAGGSAYFDLVARELTAVVAGQPAPKVVLRGGCYLTHDHGHYERTGPGSRNAGPELVPAMELHGCVLSRPEPGLALVAAGRRDVSFDHGLPVPLRACQPGGAGRPVDGVTVTRLDDQHAYLRLPPDSALAPGDVVSFGISHPCTTFDKWRVIPVVDDDGRVTDAIHTFF